MTDDSYTIVVIDDERRPLLLDGGTILLYRNLKDGLQALKEIHTSMGRINELWLDHDLGENPEAEFGWDTIMPVVDWLDQVAREGDPFDVDYIFVHTSSPPGAERMMAALKPHYRTLRAELPV